jgi:hypothetical protein
MKLAVKDPYLGFYLPRTTHKNKLKCTIKKAHKTLMGSEQRQGLMITSLWKIYSVPEFQPSVSGTRASDARGLRLIFIPDLDTTLPRDRCEGEYPEKTPQMQSLCQLPILHRLSRRGH